jgi:hypothetical protein
MPGAGTGTVTQQPAPDGPPPGVRAEASAGALAFDGPKRPPALVANHLTKRFGKRTAFSAQWKGAPPRTRPAARPPDLARGFQGRAGGSSAWAMPPNGRTARRRAVRHAALPSAGLGCPAPFVIRLGRLLAM